MNSSGFVGELLTIERARGIYSIGKVAKQAVSIGSVGSYTYRAP
jgi:hypothetical protein